MTRTDDPPVPHASRILAGIAIGVASAVLVLVPWLATGAKLPLQNLWQSNVLPEAMPFSLLPVSQYYATAILVLLVLGGVLAGIAVRAARPRLAVPSWSAAVGVLLVHGIVIIQSFTVVADGLGLSTGGADTRALLYFAGMLGGTLVSAALAQGVFWLASRRSVGAASLGLALSVVPFASWIVSLISLINLPTSPFSVSSEIWTWLPALLLGAVLGWCGIQPSRRLGVWIAGLAALWITPALFTALVNALGMRVLDGDLQAMAEVATGIFPVALGIGAPPVLVALVLGGVLAGLRYARSQTPAVLTQTDEG